VNDGAAMNDERIHQSGYYADHIDQFVQFQAPLAPPDPAWDPAEELACMLQDATADERASTAPRPVHDEPSSTAPPPGGPLRDLQEITAEMPPLSAVPRSHRKLSEHRRLNGLRTLSYLIAASAAVITSMVSVFGGLAIYEPLLHVAVFHTHSGAVSYWPLLIYGPWLVAALSIVHAALNRRRAVHSWVVVLLFSSIAVLLSVVQAGGTITDAAVAALPTCASLACFQQLVRQLVLMRPRCRTRPRHRLRISSVNSRLVDAEAVRRVTDSELFHRGCS
jgi:hypothetical protein